MTNKEVSTLSKFDEWQFQWLPYQNPLNEKAGWDGTYLDHYGSFGEEFKRVASQDPRQVWSLVNVGCQGWNIMSGIQPGAYGYFITKKKRPKGNHLVTVVIEPDHDCDDPSLLGLH